MKDRMRTHSYNLFGFRKRSLRSFKLLGGRKAKNGTVGFENTVRRYVLDRTEDGFHVFEDKSGEAALRLITPAKYKLSDGDIVDIAFGSEGEILSITKDEAATKESAAKNSELLKRLFDNR